MNSFLMHLLKTTPVSLFFSLHCFGKISTVDSSKIDITDRSSHISKTEYDSLTTVLLRIGEADQHDRNQVDEVAARFGGDSPQMKALVRHMKQTDSLNFSEVDRILTQYGWLSSARVGPDANRTLFMVIQHADLAAQENYFDD